MQEHHLVFVYGTLLRGSEQPCPVSSGAIFGGGQDQRVYALYVDYYPKVIRDEPVSPIAGELYLVDGTTLALLDDLEDHPFEYRREQVRVRMDDDEEVWAWIYFHPAARGLFAGGGRSVGVAAGAT